MRYPYQSGPYSRMDSESVRKASNQNQTKRRSGRSRASLAYRSLTPVRYYLRMDGAGRSCRSSPSTYRQAQIHCPSVGCSALFQPLQPSLSRCRAALRCRYRFPCRPHHARLGVVYPRNVSATGSSRSGSQASYQSDQYQSTLAAN